MLKYIFCALVTLSAHAGPVGVFARYLAGQTRLAGVALHKPAALAFQEGFSARMLWKGQDRLFFYRIGANGYGFVSTALPRGAQSNALKLSFQIDGGVTKAAFRALGAAERSALRKRLGDKVEAVWLEVDGILRREGVNSELTGAQEFFALRRVSSSTNPNAAENGQLFVGLTFTLTDDVLKHLDLSVIDEIVAATARLR